MAGSHAASPTRNYGAVTLATGFAEPDNYTNEVIAVNLDFGGSTETKTVVAPCDGVLVGATIQSQTTTDGTNKITIIAQNESNSSADMIPSALYDDDPAITSNTKVELTLSTTAANVACDRGDAIEVTSTIAGTIAGHGVVLYFLPN